MAAATSEREWNRLEVQSQLDLRKSQDERNQLGQFATPPVLASQIVEYASSLLDGNEKIRFLDPAFGTGSFYSALLQSSDKIKTATGYEIDSHYGNAAKKLWRGTGLSLQLADFTDVGPPSIPSRKANLVICNPPYVRHHHLSTLDKQTLQEVSLRHSGVHLNGLSGLYCYFLLITHAWMSKAGIASWLIPSEFMDVNYGRQVKKYLLERVSLLRVHRFDPNDVQFDDALVSSAVVTFKNRIPSQDHRVVFTFGGTLTRPDLTDEHSVEDLRTEKKWTRFPQRKRRKQREICRLVDLFTIKRGLATGANSFFVIPKKQVKHLGIPQKFLIPILPSPRHLETDEVTALTTGEPDIQRRLYLLSCDLPPVEVEEKFPALWQYLQSGIERGVDQRYLCRHRSPWYCQEKRPPARFMCSYMGREVAQRESPFRFILNHSVATAANVYLLLYPKREIDRLTSADSSVARRVWQALSSIVGSELLDEGRVYGGGLHKLEPKELANVSAEPILSELGTSFQRTIQKSMS